MSPKKYVAGNWKMNLDVNEGEKLVKEILKLEKDSDVHVVLAPPFTHLSSISGLIKDNSNVHLAAQNCHHNLKGAHTGEISISMLKSVGVEYVIIGHSERRADNNEDVDILKSKVDTVLSEDVKVIFCCGEPLVIRNVNGEEAYVREQLENSIGHLSPEQMESVIIAYEPIWAIGTGVTATSGQAQDMHRFIRAWLIKKFGTKATSISILYGGSCKPTNAKELFSKQDINGGLIGGAALKADSFVGIINGY